MILVCIALLDPIHSYLEGDGLPFKDSLRHWKLSFTGEEAILRSTWLDSSCELGLDDALPSVLAAESDSASPG
jgi:hypothetical protein